MFRIRNDAPLSKINIKKIFKQLPFRHKADNICSIYIPPSDDIDEVKKIIDQLPKPFILLGDLNSQNTLWVCKDTKKGKSLEEIINENVPT